MSEVISNSGSCRIDLAGNWMHKVNGIEIRGCPFNSVSKKMLQDGSHRDSRDYKSYKAVFEEIENINFNTKDNIKKIEENIGAPSQGQ